VSLRQSLFVTEYSMRFSCALPAVKSIWINGMRAFSRIVEQTEESIRTRKVVCTEVVDYRAAEEIAQLLNCNNAVQKYTGETQGSFPPAEIDYAQRVKSVPAGLSARERMLLFQAITLYQKHANNPEGDCGRLIEVCA